MDFISRTADIKVVWVSWALWCQARPAWPCSCPHWYQAWIFRNSVGLGSVVAPATFLTVWRENKEVIPATVKFYDQLAVLLQYCLNATRVARRCRADSRGWPAGWRWQVARVPLATALGVMVAVIFGGWIIYGATTRLPSPPRTVAPAHMFHWCRRLKTPSIIQQALEEQWCVATQLSDTRDRGKEIKRWRM